MVVGAPDAEAGLVRLSTLVGPTVGVQGGRPIATPSSLVPLLALDVHLIQQDGSIALKLRHQVGQKGKRREARRRGRGSKEETGWGQLHYLFFVSIEYYFFNFMAQLTKPVFIKVHDLLDARNGYNVIGKIVKTEEVLSNDGLSSFVRAVIADETGSANAFFKGDSAKLIKEGSVIAIRNGRIRLIKNHISLEIDIFGRITNETFEVKEINNDNISEKEIERRKKERKPRDNEDKPRRPRENEDRPRRPREDRPAREDRPTRGGERGERQEGGYKGGDRENRGYRGDRETRGGDRETRGGDRETRGGDRETRGYKGGDRQEGGYRGGDRQERDNRGGYKGGDRENRGGDRGGERGERRPPLNWTKISAIEPADENLNIIAKIVSAERVKNRVRVVIGDETGTVKAFLYHNEGLEEGNTIVLFKAKADVNKEHIEVQLGERGRAELARREIREVNKEFDVSAKEWVEAA